MPTEGPGRFQGEPAYVRYFWELANDSEGDSSWPLDDSDGDQDPTGPEVIHFTVDSDEAVRFNLPYGQDIWLTETNDGFVIHWTDRAAVAAYFGVPADKI